MFEIKDNLSIQEKLHILADAAKYDVACTSSGADRKGKEGYLGNAKSYGICHSFAADGRCISLLKILMSNHCIYDCKYCINRASNDIIRTSFTPEELCSLTMEFYRRNYIEGLFLFLGIIKNPTYTMELMCQVLEMLRNKFRFNGYIHIKAIPGADDELLARAGYLADRVSINLELPTAEGIKKLAPNKNFQTILNPMKKLSDTIAIHRLAVGKDEKMERSTANRYLPGSIFSKSNKITDTEEKRKFLPGTLESGNIVRNFAPAGQSTQMIIGATDETDLNLIKTTENLYRTYDLKRVFFSAYIPINEDPALPSKDTQVPLLREHRLYQADWLMRYYGFGADELLSEKKPFFNEQLDPKCDWALRHLEQFPVEVETAPYHVILRVPGIGPKTAKRIIETRRFGTLDFNTLKKMGVVLKRAHFFITCGGRMMYKIPIEEKYIERQLISDSKSENWQFTNGESYRQMSLFDDFSLS